MKPSEHTYTITYLGTSEVKTGSAKVTITVKAPVKLVRYKNCAALNDVHPHGVGRSGAKDKVSGNTKPVTDFLRHIACTS